MMLLGHPSPGLIKGGKCTIISISVIQSRWHRLLPGHLQLVDMTRTGLHDSVCAAGIDQV